MKTRKSVAKRFKVTKNGKVLRRSTGLNHFGAKKTAKETRENRKWKKLNQQELKRIEKSAKITRKS